MLRKRYSKDLDTLVALISQLSYGDYSRKTTKTLAADISIPEKDANQVLSTYKALFREEPNTEPDVRGEGPNLYSLHLRWGLNPKSRDDGSITRDPLAREHITALFSFVSEAAKDERSRRMQLFVAAIAGFSAIVAASIAAYIKGG
jgi:hypothetical protein